MLTRKFFASQEYYSEIKGQEYVWGENWTWEGKLKWADTKKDRKYNATPTSNSE